MRLFIAIHFSEEIHALLLESIASLKAQSLSGSFTSPKNLHLTLAFIGETNRVSAIRRAMDEPSADPFSLTVSGCGRFGNLWWAGVKDSPALSRLATELQNSLRHAGFSIESRPFKPHITLGRQIVPRDKIFLTVPSVSMTVKKISLMKSERLGGRLTYTPVYERSLLHISPSLNPSK